MNLSLFLSNRDMAECVLSRLGPDSLERLRCVDKTLKRAVNQYMDELNNYLTCVNPRTFFNSRSLRFYTRGNNLFSSNQFIVSETGTEYDLVEIGSSHEFLIVHRETGTIFQRFFVLGLWTPVLMKIKEKNLEKTLVLTPEFAAEHISSPCAPLIGFESLRGLITTSGHSMDPLANSFLGKIYNRSCDTDSKGTLQYIRSSYWVENLQCLVVLAERLPWIVVVKEDGSLIKAHLPCPKDLPRVRPSFFYHHERGLLFVVGGRGLNNRRTSCIFSFCLKEYVDEIRNYRSTRDLYLDSECFLRTLKDNLLKKDPTSFDERDNFMFLPQHPNYILFLTYLYDGLIPSKFRVSKNLFKYHTQELTQPRSDCLVKSVKPYPNIFIVCGGTSTHNTKLSGVEFYEIYDDYNNNNNDNYDIRRAYTHASKYVFCPDI